MKTIACILTLLLSGCASTHITLPDGTVIARYRFLTKENIGSVSKDESSFTLDAYESESAQIVGAAIRAGLGVE